MTRPAAGSTGGRGAPLCAVLAGLLAAPLVGLAPVPAAAAAPGDPAPVSEDDATVRPVQVEVTRIDPRALTPDAVVTIGGTLTNTGSEALTGLEVRLQRGEVLQSRAALQATDADRDPVTGVATPFQPVPGELRPGGSLAFALTTTVAELQIDRDGVYPVLLNLNGMASDGERRRVGELSTFLVQPPAQPTATTGVAWLWPLVERTHRDAAGRFADDGLADAVEDGGRLDRVLAAVERLPETAPPEGGEPSPAVRVTLAVDPALVEELELMAAGPYDVGEQDDAGQGTEEAAEFLDRLRAVAADHPVAALPYGDVDADALTAAGLSDVVTRSLPGTPDGTAQDDPDAPAPATATGEVPPPAEAGDGTGAGAQILRDTLGIEPRTDLAWAVGGSVRPDTLATLQAGGVRELVLSPDGLTDGTAALGLDGGGAAARTTVPVESGEVEALVADSGLSGLAGAAPPAAGGARVAEQRYLAELSLLALSASGDPAGQTVLVAPTREVDPDPGGVAAMMAAAAQLPWLRPATVSQLGDGPTAATGELGSPDAPGGLEAAGLADVVTAVGVRDDLAGAVVEDPGTTLAPYDAAVARAVSAAWRDDPAAFDTGAAELLTTLGQLRERVTLLSPADGTYSLGSGDAPLVLTVRNDLPFAVRVLLRVQPRGNAAITIDDIGAQVLAPGQRTTLQVPAAVSQSGRFGVVATLTTPDGGPLGDPVELQVKSTAYGSISLIITIGAAALLGLLFLRRLVRFLLRRRRGPEAAAEQPQPQPLPPTRSPV
ncbi:DUF6049 family protein [Geodermatophilus sabuli]|uniref:Glycoprotein n=1 Tax=Geodermatophilus sabuli TaxID=1564158 RepID=A0A285EEY1_9ACTN|nr:DUF6049 family protein [Geodermatophilus sabuli]MBB3086247.1 hypothetical protein [Geodermatophilus sabuli]SNX97537.1 hypothetical protein SAMN06893097_107181 [Geodermatophilus sabuli]